jgi:hypothetical protein
MKFKYKKYGTTLRPVIPVVLTHKGTRLGYEVLVDSGADMCIFHAEIGEALGIDILKGKKQEVFGVGGKASVYYMHKVTIAVGGWEYNIDAGFLPDVSGRVMRFGLVGQQGFFSNFKVSFDLSKESIELKQI